MGGVGVDDLVPRINVLQNLRMMRIINLFVPVAGHALHLCKHHAFLLVHNLAPFAVVACIIAAKHADKAIPKFELSRC